MKAGIDVAACESYGNLDEIEQLCHSHIVDWCFKKHIPTYPQSQVCKILHHQKKSSFFESHSDRTN